MMDADNNAGNQASLRNSAVPQYPTGDHTAYVKNLPFPPLFPTSAWNTVSPRCDPSQSYYTVNHGNNTVTHFGTCPLRRLVTIPVRSRPLNAALTPDAKLLLVASFDSAVTFIDTSTDQVVFSLPTPGVNPSGLAISPDGTRAYVTNFTNPGSLLVVDIPGRRITTSISMSRFPRNVFLTPDGSQAWVNFLATNTITIIDTLTNTVGSTFLVGGTTEAGIAFNPTGTRAYIAVRPGRLTVIDTATLATVANVAVGAWPVDVIVTGDGGRILVDDFSARGTLTAIDAATNRVVSSLDTGGPISGMVLYPQIP
jgi:YVTN family beta-propeller protein